MSQKNWMDRFRAPFEKGGKLERFYPMYDAIETFLYTPGHTTHVGAHIRDAVDLKRTMMTVILALLPALFFGMWNIGFQHAKATGIMTENLDLFLFGLWKVLPLIIVSYAAGLSVEFAFCIINRHSIQEGILVSGLLIPMIMPIDVPLWALAFATALGVLITKEVFGGTGMNIFNVALMVRAILFFAYPTQMSGDKVWIATGEKVVDGYSGATALGDLAGITQVDQLQTIVEKYPFWDAFLGFIPGSVGETSTLACLIGALILILTGVGSWRIITSFFLGGFLVATLFNLFPANVYMELPALHQLVLGGFAFGAVFMATDPVTAAQTERGKYFYGFFGGVLAILIRVVNPAYPEGVMMAILFMNAMAPLIDHYVVQGNIKKRLQRVKK